MPVSNKMMIGDLAAAAGCTVPTVRYYEEIALLPKANRSGGGQRVYGDADLRRLTFIRRCRDFGFSIEHVRELVTLTPDRDCVAARDVVAIHLHDVRRRLKEWRALERTLKTFVDECNRQCAGGPARACVILEDLADAKPARCCSSAAAAPVSARAR
jgi:DNA-binding transcriptional MerR regulator